MIGIALSSLKRLGDGAVVQRPAAPDEYYIPVREAQILNA
jgi:hypothetical protein